MQIFEVIEQNEFPYMESKEILQGSTIQDLINENNENKVFLVVDHDSKRIWTYNGSKSPFKLQIYGGILANLLRTQLKLFYRVFSLNAHSRLDPLFQEILSKPIGGGRAKAIEKDDIKDFGGGESPDQDLCVHPDLRANQALDFINSLPSPENFIRRFIIVAGNVYADEETTEAFLTQEKFVVKSEKLGQLNRGFMFFEDIDYSTRLIVKDRKVQGLELFVPKEKKAPPETLNVPILYEEKFNRPGVVDALLKSFQIPDKMQEEPEGQTKSQP